MSGKMDRCHDTCIAEFAVDELGDFRPLSITTSTDSASEKYGARTSGKKSQPERERERMREVHIPRFSTLQGDVLLCQVG